MAVRVLLHTLVIVALLLVFVVLGARLQRAIHDFNIKASPLSEFALALMAWLVNYWYLLPFILFPFLALDGAILYWAALKPRTRKWGSVWSVLVMLLALAGFLVLLLDLGLTLVTRINEGLSK
jgi:hypothetical protein